MLNDLQLHTLEQKGNTQFYLFKKSRLLRTEIKSKLCSSPVNSIKKANKSPGNIFKWYELLQNISVLKNVLVKTREELCNFFISPNNFIHLLCARSKGYFAANSISRGNNSFIPVGSRYISPFCLYTIQKLRHVCLIFQNHATPSRNIYSRIPRLSRRREIKKY